MIRRVIKRNKGNFNKSLAKTMVICFAILNLSSGVTSYSEELPYGYNNFGEGYYNDQRLEGSGTQEDPFIIYTAEDFNNIRNNPNSHYVLGSDINLSEIEDFNSIDNFSGVLDGGNYTVKNIYISNRDEEDLGIFKVIRQGGVVKNINIDSISIWGKQVAGGIAAKNEGLIENVSINGEVGTQNGCVGGIVSKNSGTIRNVSSKVIVLGFDSLAGIAFENAKGTIEDSIFDGDIQSENRNEIGAIAAINTDAESRIRNCYWDIEKTGVFQGVPNGGISKGTVGIKYDKYIQVSKSEPQKKYITLVGSEEDTRATNLQLSTNDDYLIRELSLENNNINWLYRFKPYMVGEAQVNYKISVGSNTLEGAINVEIKDGRIYDEIVYFPDINLKKAINRGLKQQENDEISRYKLGKLKSLYASSKEISNLEGIQYCIGLNRLDLQDNKIKDISPVANLTQLTSLALNINEIEDISPVANLINLEHLGINRNKVKDITPIKNLKNLKDLGISMNDISDITPLKGKEDLTVLHADSNKIKDISPLKDSKKLIYIYIDRNNIGDISVLRDFKNLRDVSAKDQVVTLENKKVKDSLYVYKPIKFFGENGTLTNISDNGQINGNKSITYRNLAGYGESEVSISFEEQIPTLNQYRTSFFTGKVVQPITFTQEDLKVEDINKDGQVDITDLARMSTKYNLKSSHEDFNPELDINRDNIIDIFDLSRVAKKINK